MSDLESRLDAVERALTDADRGPGELADAAAATDRLAACEERMDDLEERLADLEAAVEALRGYVGQARREDREAERTAEAALAAAERLERRLDGGDELEPEPLPLADDAAMEAVAGENVPEEDAEMNAPASALADDDGPLARLRDAL